MKTRLFVCCLTALLGATEGDELVEAEHGMLSAGGGDEREVKLEQPEHAHEAAGNGTIYGDLDFGGEPRLLLGQKRNRGGRSRTKGRMGVEASPHRAEREGEQTFTGGVDRKEVLREQKLEAKRDLLNTLVDESVAKTDSQACNVAFLKTHKTASTTLAMVLVRYARRHSKKLASFKGKFMSTISLERAVDQVQKSGERVSVMHYHVNHGAWRGDWETGLEMYQQIMQETEAINYITVVRSPREHFLSYYYYYLQPINELSIEQYLTKNKGRKNRRLTNPMCHEFGVNTAEQLDTFIDKHLPNFLLAILTDELDEGLMTLRHLMGWDMIDVTYSVMMETKKGVLRWDSKELVDVPLFESLPRWVQDVIDENTLLDKRLYDATTTLFKEKKQEVEEAGGNIDADLVRFNELQQIVGSYLEGNASSDAHLWYASDVNPYDGGPPFYPF